MAAVLAKSETFGCVVESSIVGRGAVRVGVGLRVGDAEASPSRHRRAVI
tara:strand:- start:374 stop:520 length:147 start_codon:yes stop_codon:yes gene_type:complete